MAKRNEPSPIDKPFYLTKPIKEKYKRGQIIQYAPYNCYLKVLDVYNSNWFKYILRKLGIRVRINELRVIKLNKRVKTIYDK